MFAVRCDSVPFRHPSEPAPGAITRSGSGPAGGNRPAWSRRRALAAALAGVLGTAGVAASTSTTRAAARPEPRAAHPLTIRQRTPDPTTFVLVHGGWHGGWSWNRVAPRLRAAGHHVLTPTLSGLADRAHLLTAEIDLETHVLDIVGLLEYDELERVVLVGHSYAGMVITGVAARVPARLAHVVYLDAFVPAAGDTLLSLLPADRQAYYREQAAANGDGWRVPPPPVAALGVTDEADAAWLEPKLTDQPLRSFEQQLAGNAPASLRRTYIHCTEGPIAGSFAPFAAQAEADPSWGYHELPTGHDAMVTMPDALAGLLNDVVAQGA